MKTCEEKSVQRVQCQGQLRIIGTIKAKYLQKKYKIKKKCDADKIVMYVIMDEKTGKIKPYTVEQTKELINKYKFVNADIIKGKVVNTECSMEKLFVFDSSLKVAENFGTYIVSKLIDKKTNKCIGYKVINSDGRTFDAKEKDLMKPGVTIVNAYIADKDKPNRHISAVKKEFTQTILEVKSTNSSKVANNRSEARNWRFRAFDNKVAEGLMTVEKSITLENAGLGDETYKDNKEGRKYYKVAGLNVKIGSASKRGSKKVCNYVVARTSCGAIDTEKALDRLTGSGRCNDEHNTVSEEAAKRLLQLEERYLSNLVDKTGDIELLNAFKDGIKKKNAGTVSRAIQLACVEAGLLKRGISVKDGEFSHKNILIENDSVDKESVLGRGGSEFDKTLIFKALSNHIESLMNTRVYEVGVLGLWEKMPMCCLPADGSKEMQKIRNMRNKQNTRNEARCADEYEMPDVGGYCTNKAFMELGYCLKGCNAKETVTRDGRTFKLIDLSKYMKNDENCAKYTHCVGDTLAVVNINRWLEAYNKDGRLTNNSGEVSIVALDSGECLKHIDIILALASIYNSDLAEVLVDKVNRELQRMGTDCSFSVSKSESESVKKSLTNDDKLYYESGFNVQKTCKSGTHTSSIDICRYHMYEYERIIIVPVRLRDCKRLNYRAVIHPYMNIPVSDNLKEAVAKLCERTTKEFVDSYIGSLRTL